MIAFDEQIGWRVSRLADTPISRKNRPGLDTRRTDQTAAGKMRPIRYILANQPEPADQAAQHFVRDKADLFCGFRAHNSSASTIPIKVGAKSSATLKTSGSPEARSQRLATDRLRSALSRFAYHSPDLRARRYSDSCHCANARWNESSRKRRVQAEREPPRTAPTQSQLFSQPQPPAFSGHIPSSPAGMQRDRDDSSRADSAQLPRC